MKYRKAIWILNKGLMSKIQTKPLSNKIEQERKIAEDAAKEQAIKIDTEKKAKANAEAKKTTAKEA